MGAFDDLLDANARYAEHFDQGGFDGVAHAGVAVVTCMDSRIDPLRMLGLDHGDAKILRNPGGRVTDQVLVAVVVSIHLLRVNRVLVVPHTRCAMASATEAELHQRIGEAAGKDAAWMSLGASTDQVGSLRADVAKVRTHPLVPAEIPVGGFLYDVDTGRLEELV